MLDMSEFGAILSEYGFRDFSGVPCSYLAPMINYAINENRFIVANNEGEAVAIATGISLASDSSLGMQCEGFAKLREARTTSSLTSLNFAKTAHSHTAKQGVAAASLVNTRIVLKTNADSSADSTLDSESSSNTEFANEDSKICDGLNTISSSAEGFLGYFRGFQAQGNEIEQEVHRGSPSAESAKIAKKPTRNFGVVLMQNSGLSNALSPLTSLNHTFQIGILGFVSLRGERDSSGRNTDEPQHELLGVITDRLLGLCEIEYAFLSDKMSEAKAQVARARAFVENGKSFFFIVRKNTFSKVLLKNSLALERKDANEDTSAMPQYDENSADSKHHKSLPTRLQALNIIHECGQRFNAALIATTGKCGRELYEINDTPNQLYMVGSMGCVSALGLGIALKSDKKIIAIDGDSALLMRLGTLSNNAFYAKSANKGNFCHILLDNQSHDSTGGQDNLSPFMDFCALARDCGYERVIKARDLAEFRAGVEAILGLECGGASFIYLKIARGSKEKLGRPKIAPSEVARRFSAWLKS